MTSPLSQFFHDTLAVIDRYQWKNLRVSKNIRMFESDFIEKFSYVHPLVPHAVWLPVVYWMFDIQYFEWSIYGLLFWSLAEYLLHRFVFHFDAKTPTSKRIAFLIHGIHHDDPNDERRLVMPPGGAVVFAALLYALFYVILGAKLVSPFFAGFLVGYLVYDTVHFAVHAFRPEPESWLGKLKTQHMKHHFVSHDRFYGVSSPLWDWVFRTH